MNENNNVKQYEFTETEIEEVRYLLHKVTEECKKKFFHTYKYRCVYDIKFTSTTNNKKVILNIIHDCLDFKTE